MSSCSIWFTCWFLDSISEKMFDTDVLYLYEQNKSGTGRTLSYIILMFTYISHALDCIRGIPPNWNESSSNAP